MDQREKRIQSIHKMLLELASGNFSYKIKRSENKDDLEALAILVNMMSEELKESFFHQGYVNLNGIYKHLTQIAFVLDQAYRISHFSTNVSEILFYKNSEIQGIPFIDLLTEKSKKDWIAIITCLKDNNEKIAELTLNTKQDLVIPAFCAITKLFNPKNENMMTLVSIIEVIKNKKYKSPKYTSQGNAIDIIDQEKKRLILKQTDVQKIREVHDYILSNLEQKLPSLKDLSHQLGTNEFKLKYGFKQLYGITIYRFLIKKRLEKANMLIQHSEKSLKVIAYNLGFKSFPHFSRAFKQQFKYTPSSLRKQSQNKS